MLYLSGLDMQRLMRRHHITILTLSRRMGIPMTRVRFRRQYGIEDRHVARDWLEAIAGTDPGPLHGTVQLE